MSEVEMKIHSSDQLIEHFESCPHFFKKWTQDCNCDAWGRAGLKMLDMLNKLEYEICVTKRYLDKVEKELEQEKNLNKEYDQEVKRLFAENHAKNLKIEELENEKAVEDHYIKGKNYILKRLEGFMKMEKDDE